jgi:ubiquinone/menaquinone biosynthesis C-methylase UbiE
MQDLSNHWNDIYTRKQPGEVSWYQGTPETSISFLNELNIPKTASIIDVGGGDSHFVDYLLQNGYQSITVLDISAAAITRAKQRLGDAAQKVNWIVSDILQLDTTRQFDFWHDRATFHFLTDEKDVHLYLEKAGKFLAPGAKIVVGTFSTNGPEKCSGLPVHQYAENTLSSLFAKWFHKIKCIVTKHQTPFQTTQEFLFCSFQKLTYGHS